MKRINNDLKDYLDDELFASISHILCGATNNNMFLKEVQPLTKFFSTATKDTGIENKFEYLRYQVKKYIKLFNESVNDEEKYYFMIMAKSYFCLLESTIENSKLTKNILQQLKQEFGNDYLDIVGHFDATYLSIDGKKVINIVNSEFDKQVSQSIKLYLLLKKWQDITHYMYLDIEKVFEEYINEICKDKTFKNNFLKNEYVYDNYVNQKLSNTPISLADVAKYISLGFESNVKDLLGGKSYGLGVLTILNQNVPNAYIIPVDYKLSEEDLELFSADKKYSVRSSANIEDGDKHSLAGMFSTYLDISKDDLIENINKVKESINNERVKAYINNFELTDPKMAVVIQEFEEPEKAGIWIGNSLNSGIMEYTDGNGEKLVSGHVTPNTEVWDENGRENCLMVGQEKVGEILLNLQKEIYRNFGVLPDFEWCICNDQLRMLQFRAATSIINICNAESNLEKNDLLHGIPCSQGKFEGTAKFVRNPDQLDSITKDDALLAVFTDPDWVKGMMNAGAIITAMGGFLCHAAIIARELKIPCITGIGIEGLKKIKDTFVSMDGSTGIILIKT